MPSAKVMYLRRKCSNNAIILKKKQVTDGEKLRIL